MKSADTMPLRATGGDLLGWADGDSTFDIFRTDSDRPSVSATEMAGVRPAIVTTERQLVWGFHYRPVWEQFPSTEFPLLTIGDAAALHYALVAEDRIGEYRLSELDRIRRLVERTGAVNSAWKDLYRLLSAETDPWPLVERFRMLPAVLADAVDDHLIDLRTAEAIPDDVAVPAGRFLSLLAELSFSNRRQALRMVVELLRGGSDADTLVEEVSQLSRRRVIPFLRERRYPTLTDLERRFEAARRRVLSGTGVTLAPPDNFEGDRFQVSFTFRTGEELRSRVKAAERLKDELDELLDLLF